MTIVRASNIRGAGKGPFAKVDLLPGDRIARYSDKVLNRRGSENSNSTSKYIVKIHDDLFLDGEDINNFEGKQPLESFLWTPALLRQTDS